jgi:hypothetical protein
MRRHCIPVAAYIDKRQRIKNGNRGGVAGTGRAWNALRWHSEAPARNSLSSLVSSSASCAVCDCALNASAYAIIMGSRNMFLCMGLPPITIRRVVRFD